MEKHEVAIRCDCGHVTIAGSEAAMVAAAQAHARATHNMDLPDELLLTAARIQAAQSQMSQSEMGRSEMSDRR